MESAVRSQHAPRRSWSLDEKQRIVELTQRKGASIGAVAREHGVHATVVSHWRRLFRDGKLVDRSSRGSTRKAAPAVTFLPVTMKSQDTIAASSVHIAFPAGVVIRIETPRLDTELLCALLAQVQR